MSPPPLALILAAGASSRMGQPKALLQWQGRPWIALLADALLCRCAEVRVVLGAHREAIAAALPPGATQLWNPDWASSEPRDSLRLGLAGLAPDQRVLCCPVDSVPPPLSVLDALLAHPGPAVPHHRGRDGHPVLLVAGPSRAALLRHTLQEVLIDATRVEVGWSMLDLNLNTPADWRAFRRQQRAPGGGNQGP